MLGRANRSPARRGAARRFGSLFLGLGETHRTAAAIGFASAAVAAAAAAPVVFVVVVVVFVMLNQSVFSFGDQRSIPRIR